MFKSLECSINYNEKNILLTYFKDAVNHLSTLKPNLPLNPKPLEEIFCDLGFIDSKDSLNNFILLANKKFKLDKSELEKLFQLINHEHGLCIIYKICKKCRSLLQLKEQTTQKPTVIDLFCGAGGMSLGFIQAGYKAIFANDIDPHCIETYKYNHPEINPNNIVLGDITHIHENIITNYNFKDVSVIIGGPPCQGFSIANKYRLIDDPRNRLYKEFVTTVSKVQPMFFVMENVIGIKKIANQICEDFKLIGYDVHYETLNAVDFGVAQQRKRVFFIGNRIGVSNKEIFENIHNENLITPTFTLEDAISDLPVLKAQTLKNKTKHESEENGFLITSFNQKYTNLYLENINLKQKTPYLYNHKARYNNNRDIEIFSRMEQGNKSNDPKIADIMPYSNRNDIFIDKYYKLIYTNPCKTITAHMKYDCNMYIHPTQARGLTPREAARVQSYPDEYFFKGPFTKTYMQIGNSVPPLMSRCIAKIIKKYLPSHQLNN